MLVTCKNSIVLSLSNLKLLIKLKQLIFAKGNMYSVVGMVWILDTKLCTQNLTTYLTRYVCTQRFF